MIANEVCYPVSQNHAFEPNKWVTISNKLHKASQSNAKLPIHPINQLINPANEKQTIIKENIQIDTQAPKLTGSHKGSLPNKYTHKHIKIRTYKST